MQAGASVPGLTSYTDTHTQPPKIQPHPHIQEHTLSHWEMYYEGSIYHEGLSRWKYTDEALMKLEVLDCLQ